MQAASLVDLVHMSDDLGNPSPVSLPDPPHASTRFGVRV
jgi:hypothetical protein